MAVLGAPSKRPSCSTEKTVQKKARVVRLLGCSSTKENTGPVEKVGEYGLKKNGSKNQGDSSGQKPVFEGEKPREKLFPAIPRVF